MSEAHIAIGSPIPKYVTECLQPLHDCAQGTATRTDDPRKVERYLPPHEISNPRYHQCMLGITLLLSVNFKQVVCSFLVCDYF